MNDKIIKVENISKKYHIGHLKADHSAFGEALAKMIKAPIQRTVKLLHGQAYGATDLDEIVWALKDVSFEVTRGDRIGIIGRNGAGKSTLLKILSRITEPTTGKVEICGRVGSLLEVGTGFHQELTGRENIFLNGAILGMRKKEIIKKFDEIVSFSEIEKFIDTPVKFYSSGMYVRLAFAVAAHLEPDILLVDEVLSVGDLAFQKKCLGKMNNVSKQGRTVLFISHNMSAVSNLCNKGILLEDGKVKVSGDIYECVKQYISTSQCPQESVEEQIQQLERDRNFRLHTVSVSQEGCSGARYVSHYPIQVTIEYEILDRAEGLRVGFWLQTQDGMLIFETFDDDDPRKKSIVRQRGIFKSVVLIPGNMLKPGSYTINIVAGIHMKRWIIKDQIYHSFFIEQTDGVNMHYANKHSRKGVIMPLLNWEIICSK